METFTDDTVVALASFLAPHDMLSLASTCKRFGDKNGTTTSRSRRMAAREARKSGGNREVRQKTESISLIEVAAHTVLHAKWTDDEKNALPRQGDESWIGIYQEFLRVFCLPLQFDKLVGECSYSYVGRGNKATVCSSGFTISSAICSNIMRAGKHYVSFQVDENDPTTDYGSILCGIMRPTTKNITSLRKCFPVDEDLSSFSLKDYEILHTDDNVDCCAMNTNMGNGLILKRWKKWEESELMAMDERQRIQAARETQLQAFDWEGMEQTQEASYKVGFALDLDEGTLDVYKNDRRLGTLRSGLVGEYCWVVTMISISDDVQVSVSIDR